LTTSFTAAVVFVVHGFDRCLGFLIAAHFDEAESFRTPRVSVHDDLGGFDHAERFEHGLEIGVGKPNTEDSRHTAFSPRRASFNRITRSIEAHRGPAVV